MIDEVLAGDVLPKIFEQVHHGTVERFNVIAVPLVAHNREAGRRDRRDRSID